MVDASRRGFFRGRPLQPAQLRPPWALSEAGFLDACTRCNDCLNACPTRILVSGDGGYPTVDFQRGECTFCGDCVTACRPRALQRADGQVAWTYRLSIDNACLPQRGVECRVCGEFCEVRAIRFAPRLGQPALPDVDPAACTACGACVAPCPTGSIRIVL